MSNLGNDQLKEFGLVRELGSNRVVLNERLSDDLPDTLDELTMPQVRRRRIDLIWQQHKAIYQVVIHTETDKCTVPNSSSPDSYVGVYRNDSDRPGIEHRLDVFTAVSQLDSQTLELILDRLASCLARTGSLPSGGQKETPLQLTDQDIGIDMEFGSLSVRELGGAVYLAISAAHIKDLSLSVEQKQALVDLVMQVVARHVGKKIRMDEDFPVDPLPD